LSGLHPDLDGIYQIDCDPVALQIRLIIAAEKAFPRLCDRQRLLEPIARALGVDLAEILANGRFRLLDRAGIKTLHRRGIDIQLHSHTHRLPDESFESMADEISRNRNALKDILNTDPSHFCYPSGEYSAQHPEWLKRLGIASASTCDPGLNGRRTNPFLLKRYLDSDRVSDIAFEAEVCGLRHLARSFRSWTVRRKPSSGGARGMTSETTEGV
jgi:peptidoglycan/xylan/chitin deacetylase (PgdA/CDA1 family)